MGLTERVLAEVRSGCPGLQGARVDVAIPVRRAVLDQILPLVPGLPRGFALLLGPDQQVQVRYGSFYANARVRPEVALRPAPVITVELASQLVAWGLQTAALPPFVRVSGRLIQIRLAEIPGLQTLAGLWRHLHRLTATSSPAGLHITASLALVETGPSTSVSSPTRHAEGDPPMTDGRLQAWLRDQLAAGLPALAGARVTGTVPLPVALLNELIAAGLAEAAAGPVPPRAASGGPDLATLVRLVRHVRVDAAPGLVTLNFEVGVDG